MDISGLTSIITKDELVTWLTDNLVTPVSPAISASDLGAILEKMSSILGPGVSLGADNGLQIASGGGGGNNVELGGNLNAGTTIGLGGKTLIFAGTENNTTSLAIGDQSGDPYIALTVTDTTDSKSVLSMGVPFIKLQYKSKSLVFDDGRMTIDDPSSGKGLENNDDYEAGFTARSLVTKQYVDGAGGLKAPLDSPAFTGAASITQPNQPTVSTGSGANAPAVFTVHGGAGGATTSSDSVASGGAGSNIDISAGGGGSSSGNSGTAIGGNGGDISLAAGRGGSVTGTHTNGFPGAGGSVNLAGGPGGTHANTSGPGGGVNLTGGMGGAGNSDGGSIHVSAGAGVGTGSAGSVFLGYDGAGHVGNILIGGQVDDYTHVLQVYGPAIFTSLTAKINKRVLVLSANSATPGVNTDNYDVVHITGQTTAIIGFTMTGTPVDGDTLRISITGTASVPFTLGSLFEPSGCVALSTTTQGTHRLDMGFVWNTETSKWRQIAVA